MGFTVNLKVLSGFCNLKNLSELVGAEYLVGLSRNVLDALRGKDNRLAVSAETRHHILIHKTFDVELPQHKFLSGFIEAHHAPVLVNFAFWILGLRVIRALVLHVNKLVVHNEAVFTMNLRHARLTATRPLPDTD